MMKLTGEENITTRHAERRVLSPSNREINLDITPLKEVNKD